MVWYWIFIGWWWNPLKWLGRVLLWVVFLPAGIWRSWTNHKKKERRQQNAA